MSGYVNGHIASIPTRYNGVNFRSRTEARWAALFDLLSLEWIYEPIDFKGWIPDFLVKPAVSGETVDVYAEVKPIFTPSEHEKCFEKAMLHSRDMWVLLLGAYPMEYRVGHLMDPPKGADAFWSEVLGVLSGYDIEADWEPPDLELLWREAGNRTQWRAPDVIQ